MSLCRSMCGPFKRNAWDSSSPPSHSSTIPAGFIARSYGTSLPGTRTLGWGPRVGLGPFASQGDLCSQDILPIINRHTGVWDQPILPLYPPASVHVGFSLCLLLSDSCSARLQVLFNDGGATTPRALYNEKSCLPQLSVNK